MHLIDRYVASPDFRERHSTKTRARAEIVLANAAAYKAEDDPFFRRMIGLRELPMRARRAFSDSAGSDQEPFGIDNFTLLKTSANEIVYGLAGRFWSANYGLEEFADADQFLAIDKPGIAKLAMNFTVHPDDKGQTILSTETRIVCSDRSAYCRFAPYWYLIRPVSGLIRRRTLKAIRRASEG